jgi:hypothetical protein
MKDLHEIEVQVEQTLSGFDHFEKKKVDPFFYTRLEQKFKNRLELQKPIQWLIGSPLVKPGFVAALLIVNAMSFVYMLSGNQPANTKPTMSELISTITSDTLATALYETTFIFDEDE